MKSAYVSDLSPDQSITSFFVVHEKEIRATREGRKYLRVELGDRTGTVEARMWTGFEEFAPTISRDDFVKIQGRVEMYRNRPQVMLDRLRRAEPAEVDFADFFAHTTANVDELWTRLRAHASEVSNPPLRALLDAVLDDSEIAERFKRAPAAKTMHHAYLGGLLEHVVSLCDLARNVAAHYPEADRNLLITGAVLHDVAKIYELSYDRGIGYTTEGQLLGHIVMAVEMIGRKMEAIPNFPPELAILVKHLILSHHGQYEFGSPKLPMFREAVMLHYLDDLDSKMAAIRSILASEQGEQEWTDRSGALERRMLRVERYMNMAQQHEDAAAGAVAVPRAAEQLPLVGGGSAAPPEKTPAARGDASKTGAAKSGASGRSW
jgi:3'-5' exoribonuclease